MNHPTSTPNHNIYHIVIHMTTTPKWTGARIVDLRNPWVSGIHLINDSFIFTHKTRPHMFTADLPRLHMITSRHTCFCHSKSTKVVYDHITSHMCFCHSRSTKVVYDHITSHVFLSQQIYQGCIWSHHVTRVFVTADLPRLYMITSRHACVFVTADLPRLYMITSRHTCVFVTADLPCL